MTQQTRIQRWLAAGLVGAAMMGWSALAPGTGQDNVLEARNFDYVDAEDNRSTAQVETRLVYAGEKIRLELALSAVGMNVQPIPGWMGVWGANRFTAEELEGLVQGKRVLMIRDGSGDRVVGLREIRRGRLAERRLTADGKIDVMGMTEREYTLEAVLDVGEIEEGEDRVEVRVEGMTRLIVHTERSGGYARVTRIESPGHDQRHDSGAETAVEDDVEVTKLPYDEAAWARRDIEGRWVAVVDSIEKSPESAETWVKALADQGEFELLEMLAVSKRNAYRTWGAAMALARNRAPQWTRVAAYGSHIRFGHSDTTFQTMMLEVEPATMRAWLRAHRPMGNASLDAMAAALEKMDLPDADISSLLGPLEVDDVLRAMEKADAAVLFGDRERAQDGVVYDRQVLRAIEGLTVIGGGSEKHVAILRRLIEHPDIRLAQQAVLALSYTTIDEPTLKVLRRMIDDHGVALGVREAAMVSLPMHHDDLSRLLAHRVAGETSHELWKQAVSVLGSSSNPFTIAWLDRVDVSTLDVDSREVLNTTVEQLRKRMNPMNLNRAIADSLVMAALAEAMGWTIAEPLKNWAMDAASKVEPGELRRLMDWLESPDFLDMPDAALRAKTREALQPLVDDLRIMVDQTG